MVDVIPRAVRDRRRFQDNSRGRLDFEGEGGGREAGDVGGVVPEVQKLGAGCPLPPPEGAGPGCLRGRPARLIGSWLPESRESSCFKPPSLPRSVSSHGELMNRYTVPCP